VKKHLEKFYQVVFMHGLGFPTSPDKFIIAQTWIGYLGLIISQGKIELQLHVLNSLSNFPNYSPDVKTVQIFLGCLNDIRQFYPEQAADTKLMQQILKKGSSWND